jgi:hypothetical protein
MTSSWILFLALYNLHFPLKRDKLNRNIHKMEPWFTKGRRKLYLAKCAVQVPSIDNKTMYNRYRNLYNTVIKTSKKISFEKEFEKHKSNLKITWDILRKAIRKSKIIKTKINNFNFNGTMNLSRLLIVLIIFLRQLLL